jgi:hypothetical protein
VYPFTAIQLLPPCSLRLSAAFRALSPSSFCPPKTNVCTLNVTLRPYCIDNTTLFHHTYFLSTTECLLLLSVVPPNLPSCQGQIPTQNICHLLAASFPTSTHHHRPKASHSPASTIIRHPGSSVCRIFSSLNELDPSPIRNPGCRSRPYPFDVQPVEVRVAEATRAH